MKNVLGWVCVSAWALGGCGDGGPPPIDTGIADSTRVADLTDEQAVQACIAAERWEREQAPNLFSERELCTLLAVSFTEDAATCEAAVISCRERGLPPDEPDGDTPEQECAGETAPDVGASCDATVGELEACANARVDANQRALAELDCSYAGDEEAVDELSDRYEPAICRDLERRCPELDVDLL